MHRTSLAIRLALLPALAAGVALGASAQTSSGTDPSSNSSTAAAQKPGTAAYRGLRASEMIGMSVRNTKGDNIGQIGDMIVNMDTGEVRYAILRFDPGILSGEKLFAVPTKQLRIAPDRNDVVFDMSEQRLERASIDRAGWGERVVAAPGFTDKFDKVWGITQPWRGARAHRVSDLLGKDVDSKSGEGIGEIEELIVNMATGNVHYAVLEFDPSWASPEQNYAVPLSRFDLTGDRDELVLDVDKSTLGAMKSFPDSRWANLNDPVWVADVDRYLVMVVPGAATNAAAGGDASKLSTSELFTRLDENRNGSLDKAEVKDTADVDGNWAKLDGNSDGGISRDEFTANYTIEPKR